MKTDLRPLSALTHPAWLAALVLLVLNDHMLKASGAMPAVSGKLSDFAGLLVAPVLLAGLMRVRSQRGLWLSAAAVGSVFAAINVSPSFAAAWDAMVSTVMPFRTTVDPTDLVALVMLPVGVVLFGPTMANAVARSRARRGAQFALATVGILMCTATSEDESCTTNADCGNGYMCVNEWCEMPARSCTTDADCPEAHLECAENECSYRPTCSLGSQCPSGTCEADGRCDLAGVPVSASNMSMSSELELRSIDEESRDELELRPIQAIDPVLLDYLHDPANPVAR